ncbi:hypothetical protein B7C62_16315 [Kitasatospora albolonga]|uniref:Uncharacterized protein n=1 Tax=Kitasatospora albolonga TaxID=68173 RepID=A0ABC8BT76_9ACTN|nr:hypothetical protein B7C62_16315 [Kitasatospora albolonga]
MAAVLALSGLVTGPAGAAPAPVAEAPVVALDTLTFGCEGSVPGVGGWHHYRSSESIAGHPGFRLGYNGTVTSETSGIAVQVMGFEDGRMVWVGVGLREAGWGAQVPWGNTLAQPEIRARAVGPGGRVSFGPCKPW